MKKELIKTDNYLIVVDDSEIKEGDWYFLGSVTTKNMILKASEYKSSTNCKKVIAHLPITDSADLKGVPLLPPLEIKDNIDDNLLVNYINKKHNQDRCIGFIDGYDKAKEKYKFTEEDIRRAYDCGSNASLGISKDSLIESLSQPKIPTHFEFEMGTRYFEDNTWEKHPILITNLQGQTVVLGKYIY